MRRDPLRKRNVGGAVAALIAAIACLIIGLHALSHPDHCGDAVMHPGDLCPNHSSRTGDWINDADQQQARNHRLGVAMLAGSAGFVVAAGLIYRFTSGEQRQRRRGRPPRL